MGESERSTEATVAGEAAAAAVDEVQTREALTDAVAVTAVAANTAEVVAQEAATDAQTAVQAASEAVTATAEVAGNAAQAQETAEVATAVASQAAQESAETRERVETVDEKLDRIMAYLTAQAEPQQTTDTGVQEVEVHNAAAQPESNSPSDSESRPTRRRAGRFNRRNASG